jgi:pyruvate dehydrogenase E2 component (dihydrolipoamide acetyltransferase)
MLCVMDVERAVTAAMQRLLTSAGAQATSVCSGARPTLHHLEAGAGAPVVLLHGGTGGGANWFRILPLLAPHYRIFAPDLPGFGLSEPVAPAAPMGVVASDILARWLDANALPRVHVVGTSFGGLAALRLAQRYPERVTTLFLLDAAGLGTGVHAGVRMAAIPALTRALVQPSRAGTRALVNLLLTSDRSQLSRAQLDALVDYIYLTAVRAGTDYGVETLRLFASAAGQREVVTPEELQCITMPVMVMWGERDRLLPVAHARRAAGHMPAATLRLVPRAGHSPNWEAPSIVASAIREHAR